MRTNHSTRRFFFVYTSHVHRLAPSFVFFAIVILWYRLHSAAVHGGLEAATSMIGQVTAFNSRYYDIFIE